MATTTAPATTDNANIIDRAEVTRTMNMVKHEVTELFNDAARKRPYFAPSKKEAEAKLNAALKVLTEFAANLDAIKKR